MSQRIESTLKNMVALVLVYLKTKEPIEETARQKELQAIRQVLPEFDSIPASGVKNNEGVIVYPVVKENKLSGFAVKTYTEKGFSGHIELMAGFLTDGSIYNIEVLQQKETPGLGTKMNDPKFKNQFAGKKPQSFKLKVKKDGGEVDAITSATVSSRAFCDAVQRAYDVLNSSDIWDGTPSDTATTFSSQP
jgi:electron transport complex protein RnfG